MVFSLKEINFPLVYKARPVIFKVCSHDVLIEMTEKNQYLSILKRELIFEK